MSSFNLVVAVLINIYNDGVMISAEGTHVRTVVGENRN